MPNGSLTSAFLFNLPPAEIPIAYAAPLGDFSALQANPDGTFTRRLPDGTEYRFDTAGLLTEVVDRNGNATDIVVEPRRYLAQRVARPIDLKGDLSDPQWAALPSPAAW